MHCYISKLHINKRYRKLKRQSRIDNTETQTTLDTRQYRDTDNIAHKTHNEDKENKTLHRKLK